MVISTRGGAKSVTTVKSALEADRWSDTEMAKTEEKYGKLNDKILSWEEKRRKTSRRKLDRTEGSVEKRKMKALYQFREEIGYIEKIAADARALAKEIRRNQELKVKEKANIMRTKGRVSLPCL